MAGKNSEAFSWLGDPVSPKAATRDDPESVVSRVPGLDGRPGRTRGRARTGKRSDPNYVMAGAYVERGVRERVDTALVNLRKPGEKKLEYSDLIQSLLIRWLDEVGEGDEGT